MRQTTEIGFVLVGFVAPLGTETQDMWVLKLDSMGCDTAGCQFVGKEEITMPHKELKVYPNPFTEELIIETGYDFTGSIIVSDVTGKVIRHISVNTTRTNLKTNELAKGLYFIQIRNEGFELIKVEKIVKQ